MSNKIIGIDGTEMIVNDNNGFMYASSTIDLNDYYISEELLENLHFDIKNHIVNQNEINSIYTILSLLKGNKMEKLKFLAILFNKIREEE